jgi:hypothetical protein
MDKKYKSYFESDYWKQPHIIAGHIGFIDEEANKILSLLNSFKNIDLDNFDTMFRLGSKFIIENQAYDENFSWDDSEKLREIIFKYLQDKIDGFKNEAKYHIRVLNES